MSKYESDYDAHSFNQEMNERTDIGRECMKMNIKVIDKVVSKFKYQEEFSVKDIKKLVNFLTPLLEETSDLNIKMLDVYVSDIVGQNKTMSYFEELISQDE